ncbi:hypothetical protein L226DRAFT_609778 [Lentinus tigrinus ALCF2SS1-7]|uniref:Uncharacterized protein n=1 Tax=Lentinus tigrinus ALCF2SS1-6 TaxID=1328759 RepID=A0A5C2SQD8_9APHY|nr:hypothetical protein L227DRAFT_606842 [Lentinus tigrinus ALCF2SS1-6]RPD79282.1 hypothetical protein L226DRAFT_609778 [Lentinus tigrinus ALCF2SS1-7]
MQNTVILPEICHDMFTLVCTGGATDLSLVLCRKHFHAQSSRVRFHTLTLSSIASLEGFLAFTRTRPDGQKPLFRHLLLALLRRKLVQAHKLGTRTRETDRPVVSQDQLERSKALHMRFINAASELVLMVSPTLRTLSLTTTYSHPLVPFPCDMPVLEELSLLGSNSITGPDPPMLPSRKRFHLIPQSACTDMKELLWSRTGSS